MNVTRLGPAALIALPPILLAAFALTAAPAARAQQTAVSFTPDVNGIEITTCQPVTLIHAHAVQTQSAVFIDGTTPSSYAEINSQDNGNFTGTIGWRFSVTAPEVVTSLGYFDDMGTGGGAMTGSHVVGLYDANGSLLVSATISPSDTADGLFRFAPVAPVSLLPGTAYTLGGLVGTDNYAYDIQNNSGFASSINYLEDAYDPSDSGSLTFPTGTDGSLSDPTSMASMSGDGYAYFGPNLQFTSASVAGAPEPSEWAAIGFTGLGVGGLLLKARKRRAAGLTISDQKSA